MAEIRVPQLGESVVEATVARWVKQAGDLVEAGDAVVELETEKVNVEVAAEQSGVLTQILHQEGETVEVGEVLGLIEPGGRPVPPPPRAAQTAPPADTSAAEGGAPSGAPPAQAPADSYGYSAGMAREPVTSPPATPSAAPAAADSAPASAAAEAHISPVARRLAEEHGIDPSRVTGTGPGGRVMKEDVLDLVGATEPRSRPAGPTAPGIGGTPALPGGPAAPVGEGVAGRAPTQLPSVPATPSVARPQGTAGGVTPEPSMVPGRDEERVRLSRRRLTIARRLVEAQQTAAMLTTFNEIDMSAVMEVRKRRRDSFKERHGVNLGFMSFFTKASVGALKAFPEINAELQGEELILKRYYDIGVAVSTEEGLVVPVVRDADRKTFAEIEREIGSLATRARERKLTLDELRGGTFTITNGGVFGSLLSTPILNPPQVGILGMHKIEERPVAANGQVVIRPMMYVALTYDHRVVDGSGAVRFLVRIKELIEDPETLLLEG
jgi:2-oxoglutarate dehydrogenase E2 component (dihydrolipoamide succinyltransferase)